MILSLVFVVLVVFAMVNDYDCRRIPNPIPVGLALAFVPAGLIAGLDWTAFAIHVGVCVGVLALGLIPFSMGRLGGGDVKLMAAIGLWTGLDGLYPFALATAVAGGIMAVIVLVLRTPPGQAILIRVPLLQKGFGMGDQLPYAVAIGLGGLAVFPRLALAPPSWSQFFLS